MASRCCRRLDWIRFLKWTVFASVFFLISWTYRSWVIHGVHFVSSASYRECVNHRRNYEANVIGNKPQDLYVTMAEHGRLGNWMFQYASLLGIAKANGYTPYFQSGHMLTYNFKVTKIRDSPAKCLTTIEDPKPISYVDSFNHLPKANITLDGYFQSWKYFDSITDEIRQEFKFSEFIDNTIRHKFEQSVGKFVKSGREVISIHVRRGDLESFGAKRLGFKLTPVSYFANAMRYMVRRHPYSVFYIVSDDIDWCQNNINPVLIRYRKSGRRNGDLKHGGKIFVVNEEDGSEELVTSTKNIDKLFPKTPDLKGVDSGGDFFLRSPPLVLVRKDRSIVDLGLLSLANHSIISTGTFGWWGAWLTRGEVVYYDSWLAEGHAVYNQWTKGDYFPPHWIPLSGGRSSMFDNNVWTIVFVVLCLLKNAVDL